MMFAITEADASPLPETSAVVWRRSPIRLSLGWIAVGALTLHVFFASLALAKDPPMIVTISSKYANTYNTLDLWAVQYGRLARVATLKTALRAVEHWSDIEVDDIDNDGCFDDFLLLKRSLAETMDFLEWYKLEDGQMVHQGNLLQFPAKTKALVSFAGGDLDGDIYTDFLIVEKSPVLDDSTTPPSTYLSHYEFDPCNSSLEFQDRIDLPLASRQYELIAVDMGDWDANEPIDIITLELDPHISREDPDVSHISGNDDDIHPSRMYWSDSKNRNPSADDLIRIRRYHFDDEEFALALDQELAVVDRWVHDLKAVEICPFDPDLGGSFITVDGILYDTSSTLAQWADISDGNDRYAVGSFLLIMIPAAERLVTAALVDPGQGDPRTFAPLLRSLLDISGDGKTNLPDLAFMGGQWGRDTCGPENDWCSGADLDYNHVVNFLDAQLLAEAWVECTDPGPESGVGVLVSGDTDSNDGAFVDMVSRVGVIQEWLTMSEGEFTHASTPWYPCWENPRQCHGDADGLAEFMGRYWVYNNDLTILTAAFGTSEGEPGYNPCADFDRNGEVNEDDEIIINTWFRVLDVPADCPTVPDQ